MNNLHKTIPAYMLLGLAFAAMGAAACETRERVVVHDRPAVQERVVVTAPPPPVVQERVVVRP